MKFNDITAKEIAEYHFSVDKRSSVFSISRRCYLFVRKSLSPVVNSTIGAKLYSCAIFKGVCFFCHIVTITSGYKKCGCFIVCLVCAEIFKRGDLYVCPRCEVGSDCLVTPYHG